MTIITSTYLFHRRPDVVYWWWQYGSRMTDVFSGSGWPGNLLQTVQCMLSCDFCVYLLPGFKTCSAFKWDYSSTTWSAGYRPWSQLLSPGLCFVTFSVMCDYNSILWLCY